MWLAKCIASYHPIIYCFIFSCPFSRLQFGLHLDLHDGHIQIPFLVLVKSDNGGQGRPHGWEVSCWEKKWETAHIVSIFNPIEWLKHLSWFLLYSFCISCRGHHYQQGGCSKAGTLHSHWHNFIFGAQIYYLEELQGMTGIPQPLWLGKEGSYQAMILESLGSSLYCLFKQTLTTFNLPFVAKLGLQMVSSTLITL